MSKKKLIFLSILILAGAAFFTLRQQGMVPELGAQSLRNTIEQAGAWGPALFVLIYYFATLFFLSAAVLTVVSGALFGKLFGSALVVIAATAAAQTAFWLSSRFGKGVLEKLGKNQKVIHDLTEKLNRQLETNGFRTFFLLRSLFLPYAPLSYAAGLVKKARAKDFFLATLLTNMIFSPAFVFLGDSLLKGPKALILPAILIAAVLLVPRLLKKFHITPEKHET